MEPTITQNNALYFIQHKRSKPRARRSSRFHIPALVSTERATEWGSHLNPEQHTALVKAQRALSYAAATESNLQLKVNLAARSQLMREADEAFVLTNAA